MKQTLPLFLRCEFVCMYVHLQFHVRILSVPRSEILGTYLLLSGILDVVCFISFVESRCPRKHVFISTDILIGHWVSELSILERMGWRIPTPVGMVLKSADEDLDFLIFPGLLCK